MRGSRAGQERDRWNVLLAAGLGIVAILILVSVIVWKIVGPHEVPTELLCPSQTGPIGHVVLLVDKTDPLTFTQAKAFHQILEDFTKGKHVKEAELLSVFVLGEDFRQTAEPLFEKCNPGDGSNRSKLTANPDLLKRRHTSAFVEPILALERQLRAQEPAKQSPILEMLQVVALRFAKYDVQGKKSVYIVSDMLHNTPDFSLYRDPPEFDTLKRRPAYARLRARLADIDVNIFLLMNSPELQTRRLAKFWEDYFKEMGGTLQRIDPLPG